jgi:predicted alpha-1,2-mannosidase
MGFEQIRRIRCQASQPQINGSSEREAPMRYSIVRAAWAVAATAVVIVAAAGTGSAATAPEVPAALVADPASVVDTRVLTTGGGNDFPGVDLPFGMIQWSPDTSPSRPLGGGYNFNATQFRGFSLTHMAGPGCGAMQDIPILPMTGPLPAGDPGSHMEPFTHTGEVAQAGYYSLVSGPGSNIRTELTATTRSGMARWTFPATAQADLLIKLRDSQNGTSASTVTVVGTNEVRGSATSGHFCGAPDTYTVHFDIVFDRPFAPNPPVQAGPNSVFLTFNTTANQVVQAKVGISFVSDANARANWMAENGSGFAFDTVRTNAHNAWNALLNKIQIAGGTATQQQLFYTSLYHVLQHPNVVSDSNGQFMAFDKQLHTVAAGHAQYDQFSGWDIFHGQTQLSALVAPQQTSDIAQSLLTDAQFGSTHLMPQWGFMNSYNFVMAGDPAQIAMADYFAFGARAFDTATAKTVMKRQATTTNQVRPETAMENQFGYIPSDGSYGCCNAHGFLSSQLEYDQADFALSRFLLAAPNPSADDMTVATQMVNRANNWKNVFNPANRLLNPRLRSGAFVAGITPTSTNQYIEGTAAQYRFVVPFNQPALAALLGGNAATNSLLDQFFLTMDGSNPNRSFLGNEFDLGTPWFYNWTGAPSRAQSVVNRMLNTLYRDTPNGFPNNDDLGTMSANYVWGALGFYPVTPGSADLMFNSPLFTQSVIHLPSGATMTTNAPQASATNIFVQSLTVNGTATQRNWIAAGMWQNGVTLNFTLGGTASTWGSAPADAPPAYNSGATVPDNLALNHPTTADGQCNANETSAKAVNGSVTGGLSDKWCSLGAVGTQFWQVDLGGTHTVSQIVIDHAGAGGEQTGFNTRAFTLQVSTDGTTFTTVVTVTANTASVTTHDITPVNARFVRLNVVTPTNNGNGAARIYEVQVFGT